MEHNVAYQRVSEVENTDPKQCLSDSFQGLISVSLGQKKYEFRILSAHASITGFQMVLVNCCKMTKDNKLNNQSNKYPNGAIQLVTIFLVLMQLVRLGVELVKGLDRTIIKLIHVPAQE